VNNDLEFVFLVENVNIYSRIVRQEKQILEYHAR